MTLAKQIQEATQAILSKEECLDVALKIKYEADFHCDAIAKGLEEERVNLNCLVIELVGKRQKVGEVKI